MTLVGLLGLLLAVASVYVVRFEGSRQRIVVFVLLLVLHTLSSGAFYLYAQVSGSDAQFYYYDPGGFYGRTSGLGTALILNAVQIMKEQFGGTFFDYFMIFNAIGFWGFVFITKTFDEIFEELEVDQGPLVYLPLFLPGLHFWTGFIGKDAPLFLAVSLAVWACMRLNRRLVAMGVAVIIMLAARPHIAVLALVAFGLSIVLDRKTKLWVKAVFIAGALSGTSYIVTGMETTYGINVSSAEGVSEFMAGRSSVTEESGADISIVQANFPVKVLSLWLRPFFFDAENLMSYVASLENAALLIIFLFVIRHIALTRQLFKKVLYIRFSILFFIALTGLVAAVNFNVGLGLRQKMMAMPCLLALLATLIAARSTTSQQPSPVSANRAPTGRTARRLASGVK